MARIELPIDGMTCEACVKTLTAALGKVPGVRSVKVSLRDGKAVVESQGPPPAYKLLTAAVEGAGYTVVPMSETMPMDPNMFPPKRAAAAARAVPPPLGAPRTPASSAQATAEIKGESAPQRAAAPSEADAKWQEEPAPKACRRRWPGRTKSSSTSKACTAPVASGASKRRWRACRASKARTPTWPPTRPRSTSSPAKPTPTRWSKRSLAPAIAPPFTTARQPALPIPRPARPATRRVGAGGCCGACCCWRRSWQAPIWPTGGPARRGTRCGSSWRAPRCCKATSAGRFTWARGAALSAWAPTWIPWWRSARRPRMPRACTKPCTAAAPKAACRRCT